MLGAGVPKEVVASKQTLVLDCRKRRERGRGPPLLDVLVGQLLAFFRCLGSGYRPDSPSADGVITRVVSGFEIHRRDGAR